MVKIWSEFWICHKILKVPKSHLSIQDQHYVKQRSRDLFAILALPKALPGLVQLPNHSLLDCGAVGLESHKNCSAIQFRRMWSNRLNTLLPLWRFKPRSSAWVRHLGYPVGHTFHMKFYAYPYLMSSKNRGTSQHFSAISRQQLAEDGSTSKHTRLLNSLILIYTTTIQDHV